MALTKDTAAPVAEVVETAAPAAEVVDTAAPAAEVVDTAAPAAEASETTGAEVVGIVAAEAEIVTTNSVEVAVVESNMPVAAQEAHGIVAKGDQAQSFLKELGITDLKIDFTSFPKITLEKGMFSSDDNANFGTEFTFKYIEKRQTTLFNSVPPDRDTEAEVIFSDDTIHINDSDGELVSAKLAEWKEKGWSNRRSDYQIVIGLCLSGPHKDELVQLQVSPKSQGKLGGYLMGLGLKKRNPREVTTLVYSGKEVGSGQKAFTPWAFKEAPAALDE